ncbi:hypothetical protein CC78DRAFT_539772 [Lojkania enalia]|uniref:Uncharacterized protein n=1 Tax=Lojkania enalia TaxID=147567 RepID=A0A9P4NAW2_9PLEO|nr:hypothetical protein CC78DRAFT_539772 [Didymosphaeria enalia]
MNHLPFANITPMSATSYAESSAAPAPSPTTMNGNLPPGSNTKFCSSGLSCMAEVCIRLRGTPHHKTYLIRQSLLASTSMFYMKILVAGGGQVFWPPTEDIQAFDMYDWWMCLRLQYSTEELKLHGDLFPDIVRDQAAGAFHHLIRAYVLGEILEDQQFQELVIGRVVAGIKLLEDGGQAFFLILGHENINHVFQQMPYPENIMKFVQGPGIQLQSSSDVQDMMRTGEEVLTEFVTALLADWSKTVPEGFKNGSWWCDEPQQDGSNV